MSFPGCSVVKNSPANVGDAGLIPGSGRSPGEGNGNPLQYSCLEREAWRATVHGVAKESDTTQWSNSSNNTLIECATATAESLQSCPTLCDSIDGSPPGSSVPGILQARTLEWVAMIECIYLLFLTNNFRFFKIEGAVIFGHNPRHDAKFFPLLLKLRCNSYVTFVLVALLTVSVTTLWLTT